MQRRAGGGEGGWGRKKPSQVLDEIFDSRSVTISVCHATSAFKTANNSILQSAGEGEIRVRHLLRNFLFTFRLYEFSTPDDEYHVQHTLPAGFTRSLPFRAGN